MDTTTPNTRRRCGTCRHYDASTLAGYGYCRVAPDCEARARLWRNDTPCTLTHAHHDAAQQGGAQ
ncbi:hypothetical protein [Dentiradicibacter hellwigii]|uniref:Uncharacterized protein n=1 Tax=Dentiradicibacter hellwigii TaxID=3149053 RepID=A0ABV4UDB6_9RHOO